MAWITIANARRLMSKDPEIGQQAIHICKLRAEQIKEANQPEPQIVIPKPRLNAKTNAAEILAMQSRHRQRSQTSVETVADKISNMVDKIDQHSNSQYLTTDSACAGGRGSAYGCGPLTLPEYRDSINANNVAERAKLSAKSYITLATKVSKDGDNSLSSQEPSVCSPKWGTDHIGHVAGEYRPAKDGRPFNGACGQPVDTEVGGSSP